MLRPNETADEPFYTLSPQKVAARGYGRDPSEDLQGERKPAKFDLSGAAGRWIPLSDIQRLHEDDAREVFTKLRWKDGVICAHCGWDRAFEYRSRSIFKCAKCGRQFSETTRTFFRSRKLPFKTILLALATLKEGSSINGMGRSVGISYKSAWEFAKKINSVMSLPPPAPLRQHNVRETMYPFILGPQRNGAELLLAVNEAVPRSLPEQVRAEVCQDIIVAILSGEMDLGDIRKKASEYTRKVFRLFPDRYGPLSLDEPPPWMRDGRTPLGEMLDSAIEHW